MVPLWISKVWNALALQPFIRFQRSTAYSKALTFLYWNEVFNNVSWTRLRANFCFQMTIWNWFKDTHSTTMQSPSIWLNLFWTYPGILSYFQMISPENMERVYGCPSCFHMMNSWSIRSWKCLPVDHCLLLDDITWKYSSDLRLCLKLRISSLIDLEVANHWQVLSLISGSMLLDLVAKMYSCYLQEWRLCPSTLNLVDVTEFKVLGAFLSSVSNLGLVHCRMG